MVSYQYFAFTPDGKDTKGVVDAASHSEALASLHRMRVSPYAIHPAMARRSAWRDWRVLRRKPLGVAWRATFAHQLSLLLSAGVPLDRALAVVLMQAKRKQEIDTLRHVQRLVREGSSLSQALDQCEAQFGADEVGLITAGEATGSVARTLDELAALLERRLAIRRKLVAALTYPALVFALALISLIVVATVLVPSIAPLFENSNVALPWLLNAMLFLTNEIEQHGFLWLSGLALTVAPAVIASKSETVRHLAWTAARRIKILRSLHNRFQTSQFSRCLGALLGSGAPLHGALGVMARIFSNPQFGGELRAVLDRLSRGEKPETSLAAISFLDSHSLQLIAVGQETNQLPKILLHIANFEELELTRHVERLMTLLAPLLTVMLGLFVGGILMSIMTAILSINDAALH